MFWHVSDVPALGKLSYVELRVRGQPGQKARTYEEMEVEEEKEDESRNPECYVKHRPVLVCPLFCLVGTKSICSFILSFIRSYLLSSLTYLFFI